VPVEPEEGELAVAAAVGFPVGAAMAHGGVVHVDHGCLRDVVVVATGIAVGHVIIAAGEVEDGAAQFVEVGLVGSGHRHASHAGVEDDVGLQVGVGGVVDGLRSAAGVA